MWPGSFMPASSRCHAPYSKVSRASRKADEIFLSPPVAPRSCISAAPPPMPRCVREVGEGDISARSAGTRRGGGRRSAFSAMSRVARGVNRSFSDQTAEGSLDFVIGDKFASLCVRKPFEHRRQMGRIEAPPQRLGGNLAHGGFDHSLWDDMASAPWPRNLGPRPAQRQNPSRRSHWRRACRCRNRRCDLRLSCRRLS
jgi:hypothetical protein